MKLQRVDICMGVLSFLLSDTRRHDDDALSS